jgi:putative flippase GtrA
MKKTFGKFIKFSALGLLGTGIHMLVLIFGVDVLGLGPVVSSSLGAIAGALTNYWLNYKFNYRSSSRHRDSLPRFMAIASIGFVLNALGMQFLANVQGWNYLLSQIITTGTVLLWNFSLNHFWTFRNH